MAPPPEPVFLADRGEDDWARIIAACDRVDLQPGQVLVRAGDVAPDLLLVMEGELTGTPVRGARRPVTAPSVAGELAFLDGGQQELTLEAASRATVLRLARGDFELLAAAEPELGRAILADLARLVAGRLRGTTDLLAEVLGR